jgi:hypothetical protein
LTVNAFCKAEVGHFQYRRDVASEEDVLEISSGKRTKVSNVGYLWLEITMRDAFKVDVLDIVQSVTLISSEW